MKKLAAFATILIVICFFISCNKEGAGQPEPVGGDLPTNYIIMSDSTFSPRTLTVVNGSSITFINRSTVAKGIYSSDSVVINKQNILVNTSFFFKKDTVGTVIFKMAGKPAVSGSITYTP